VVGGAVARYLIRIRVDNLIVEMDGKNKEVVAFATRVAESSKPTDASEDAIERVRRELATLAINAGEHPPRLEVEAIDELGRWSYRVLPPAGFTFSVWGDDRDNAKADSVG
jgi:hypothetical protein